MTPSVARKAPADAPEIRPNVGIYAGPRVVWADDVLTRSSRAVTHEQWLRAIVMPGLKPHGLPMPRFDAPLAKAPVADAMVIRNCWVARCPFASCGGNAYEGIWRPLADGTPDFFFCCSCGNTESNGARLAIRFASKPESVESILHERPVAHTRNWLPGETIAQLREENLTHGHPVPAGATAPTQEGKR